ncbi:hypothetical protein B0T22DRAFT_489312 [Podospora appendiculata]|uniref:FAD-binding PCMH-type domain-containing protein n=1 Tax=Podospora appendiculata TaxID=314037 RepID=A0AAE0X7R5_9PEZI|nr:hypothetical protein B0T22DRAFT_489312 [Podospora appendiculata]
MKLSQLLSALALAITPPLAGAHLLPPRQAWSLSNLRLSPSTQVFSSTDPNFQTETTQRYTSHDAPTYLQSVKPALESDVQKIVAYAAQRRIPFLATGGGHGFATTFGRLKNGLEIDMSGFNNISIDATANTMTVGGAVAMGDLFTPLYNAGKEMPTGSASCVGLLGATLGGGVGRLNGLHGLIIDSLLSVRIVTGTGRLVTASRTQNSDLFWGVRGAGFNFGIVTSATFQVYNYTNGGQAMNADFLFPLSNAAQVVQYFHSMQATLPAELALILQTGYRQELGGQYLVVNAVYHGPQSLGLPLIQPLIAAGPIRQSITTVAYKDLLSASFFGMGGDTGPCTRHAKRDVYGLGLRTVDVPTVQGYVANLSALFAAHPEYRDSVFFIEAFPSQAVRAVPDGATAYPHRDINAHLLFNYGYTNDSQLPALDAFATNARRQFAATSGFGGVQTYVNYGHGDEGPAPLYGSRKLGRLRELKRTWDPLGLFGFNIPFY